MLWYAQNGDMSLPEKISGAIAYYKAKYGSNPDLIFVSPKTMQDILNIEKEIGHILVKNKKKSEQILIHGIEVQEDKKLLDQLYLICEKNL